MPFVKNSFNALLEAAREDLSSNTAGLISEGQILRKQSSIEEVVGDFKLTAESVCVLNIYGDYLVEMGALAGFMESNGIKSVEEALDLVSEVNNLDPKSVGLLVESDDYIMEMLNKASKKKDKNAKNKVLDKINKATDLSSKLKKDGYKVKKKKSKGKPIKKKSLLGDDVDREDDNDDEE